MSCSLVKLIRHLNNELDSLAICGGTCGPGTIIFGEHGDSPLGLFEVSG